MLLSIIILSYSTKDLTVNCIKSIINHYSKEFKDNEIEIVVVDNNSTDDSVSAVSKLQLSISNLRLIRNKENVGFAKGCNIGTKASSGKYLVFLNSDTEVLDKGFLKMTKFLEGNSSVAILGAKLHNVDGSLQPSTGKFYNLFNLSLMLLGAERLGLLRESPKIAKKVDWVSGGSMMVRKDLFKKMGGFDEHFFMYFEDMELCFRAKKLGLLTYFYPHVKIIHRKLGSSNKTFAIINIYKGILYFYKKHKGFWQYFLVSKLLFVKAIVAIIVGIFIRNNYLTNTYRRAIRVLS